MRFRTGAVVTAMALVLAVTACTHANPGSTVSLSTSAPTSPPTNHGRSQAYSAAISELGGYLTVWRERGRSVASEQFLVPDQRGSGGGVILRSGKVISYKPYRWISRNQFTILVTLDLHFTGSPGAWNVGNNDRFVTFLRPAERSRYLLQFATGP